MALRVSAAHAHARARLEALQQRRERATMIKPLVGEARGGDPDDVSVEPQAVGPHEKVGEVKRRYARRGAGECSTRGRICGC